MTLQLGILGAGTLECEALLDALAEYPCKVSLLGSRAMAGKRMAFGQERLLVEEATPARVQKNQVVLVTGEPPLWLNGALTQTRAIYFTAAVGQPLVPWVNGQQFNAKNVLRIPSSAAIAVATVLAPLGPIRSALLHTCESVSGKGRTGMEVLRQETENFLQLNDFSCRPSSTFSSAIAFNILNASQPENETLSSDLGGILGKALWDVSRRWVPAFVGLMGDVVVSLKESCTVEEVCQKLEAATGIELAAASLREGQGKQDIFVQVQPCHSVRNGIILQFVCDDVLLRARCALAALEWMGERGVTGKDGI